MKSSPRKEGVTLERTYRATQAGVAPCEVSHEVELEPVAVGVRLRLTLDRMHDDTWTQRAVMGWESEFGKLGRALAAPGARR
jgi:hypothetical protein